MGKTRLDMLKICMMVDDDYSYDLRFGWIKNMCTHPK